MASDAFIREKLEQYKERARLKEEGLVEPGIRPSMNYENFLAFISEAKTLKELVDKIDEYDPYDYKLIWVCDMGPIYRGVRIQVQFYKGEDIITVPYKPKYLNVLRTMIPKVKMAFTIKRSKKNDSSPGIPRTTE